MVSDGFHLKKRESWGILETQTKKGAVTDMAEEKGAAAGNENEYSPDLMTLVDEEGKEHSFEVLDAIETDDGRYLAMVAHFENPKDILDDEDELIIMKVLDDDDGEYLESIESEEEFNTVSALFTERLSDDFDFLDPAQDVDGPELS